MSVWADIPDGCIWQAGPGQWRGRYTPLTGEQQAAWLVPWDQIEVFRKVCLFMPETITAGSGASAGSITRNVPLQCKWDESLFAVNVDFEAVSSSTEDPEDEPDADFEMVRAIVTFAQPSYPVEGPTPYVEIQTEGSIQDGTIPNHPYKFDGITPEELISQDEAVPWAVLRKTVVWHQLDNPDAAEAILGPLLGGVNDAPLQIGGYAWPIDTVHFQTYSLRETRLTGNNRNASLSISLAIRPEPTWNQAMRANGAYGNVVARVSGNRPLPRRNLAALINGY